MRNVACFLLGAWLLVGPWSADANAAVISFDFNWGVTASDPNPAYQWPPGSTFIVPYTKLVGGGGAVSSLQGATGTYHDLAFTFGHLPAIDPASLEMTGWETTSTLNTRVFTPTATTDNLLQVYANGGQVAEGELLDITLFVDLAYHVTGTGNFRITNAVGSDPAFYNEVMDQTGGTGLGSLVISEFQGIGVGEFMATGSGSLTPVPEPSTVALLLTGATGLLIYGWRRSKRNVRPKSSRA